MLRTTLADSVLWLTLNRPGRLNAFNTALHTALSAALRAAGTNPAVRVVVITGAGRAFCAGQDLTDRDPRAGTAIPDPGDALDRTYNPLVRRLRGLQKPVIAAVNGVAAGAGANIALACDIVLAARSARFIQAFCKIGLVPDCGGSWLLPHILGEARAMGLALTGAPLEAGTAAAWGLIWRAVADEDLLTETGALARQLAAGPTRSLGLTKGLIHAAASNSLDAQLDLEREAQREAGRGADYREGVAAFLEKREPRFTGQ